MLQNCSNAESEITSVTYANGPSSLKIFMAQWTVFLYLWASKPWGGRKTTKKIKFLIHQEVLHCEIYMYIWVY